VPSNCAATIQNVYASKGTSLMTADQDKISAILDHLCDELTRGNHFFQIAKALQRAYDGNRLTDAPYFFAGAYDACLRESILSLAKLTDSARDSITIVYLYKHCHTESRSISACGPRRDRHGSNTASKATQRITPFNH
jgi:AbiU2